MIGGFDHVEVVFDYQQGTTSVDQCAERGQQLVDVVEV